MKKKQRIFFTIISLITILTYSKNAMAGAALMKRRQQQQLRQQQMIIKQQLMQLREAYQKAVKNRDYVLAKKIKAYYMATVEYIKKKYRINN